MSTHRTDDSEEEFESADEGDNNDWVDSKHSENGKKINVNIDNTVNENKTTIGQITNDLRSLEIHTDNTKQEPLTDIEEKDIVSSGMEDWSIWPTSDTIPEVNKQTDDHLVHASVESIKTHLQHQDSSSSTSLSSTADKKQSSAHSDNDSSSFEEK
ncbi:unnamed protein product, partial [Didymodactylos carnosus]